MPYYKGTNGDFVVQADTHEEAVAAIDRRILAGNVPVLEVEEVDMTYEEAKGYGTLEEPEGPWIAVEVYGLLTQGAHIFWKLDEAIAWWEKYTGFNYEKGLYDENGHCLNDDYDQTKIFTVGVWVRPLPDNFEKPEGIAILPGHYDKIARDKWIYRLKEKLGGSKLLVNQKLVSRDGPPGFETVYATNVAWIINWKPYEDEDEAAQDKWTRGLHLDLESALKAGAIDLRG
ncbi:hypothetical protein LCGC14_2536060 [marine sediment metagenome]|uniref:Uncharacterized protein n=1 Tax=marine sediment metagenome TaxID=412755 RepID=A0A0F9ASH9_9ZZZZ